MNRSDIDAQRRNYPRKWGVFIQELPSSWIWFAVRYAAPPERHVRVLSLVSPNVTLFSNRVFEDVNTLSNSRWDHPGFKVSHTSFHPPAALWTEITPLVNREANSNQSGDGLAQGPLHREHNMRTLNTSLHSGAPLPTHGEPLTPHPTVWNRVWVSLPHNLIPRVPPLGGFRSEVWFIYSQIPMAIRWDPNWEPGRAGYLLPIPQLKPLKALVRKILALPFFYLHCHYTSDKSPLPKVWGK